ncbi:hypothetical protein TARUN_7928 [Trichoderma arundinaceum]|uniref:Uncharacterized protein n=1 Tax=Trichoderma arundinaceum TaxID=490622 RepID=A0A395NEJ7_TRIAR|nr:hypothetical protein TARUN_7928 [Trichoderma arundinaceum]
MRGQQTLDTPAKKPPETQVSMKEIWDAAAKDFERICGQSLQRGDVRSFDDVQKKIKSTNQLSFGANDEQDDKWEKAKSVGLQSLKYLKMLVGAASQAASFIPVPEAAANITGSALCFVFDIPEAIKGYNDAINQVFGEVSSALSQFHIYKSIDSVDPLLIQQIHLVLVSFVKVCAYVVKYRQGRKRDRFLQQVKSIFDDDSGLADQMAEFRQALQQQRDVEGTVTLAVVVETQKDVALLLEQFIVFGKTAEETHQAVQETQKGVQGLKDDADRIKTLIKIRDTLGVPSTVRLETNTTQTCTDIAGRCLDGMGSWIWTHEAYTAWTAPKEKDKDTPRLLLVSGPPSSGKTFISALITKRLEEQKGRTYVAHYFFPTSTKKSDNEKDSIQSALKYMAFQIARVDVTVQKALGKACEEGPGAFRRSASHDNLESLWERLKIGASGSSAVYYFVFDGLENLPDQQAKMLLDFISSAQLARESTERVQILVSGTDDQFANWTAARSALRIQMEKNNKPDMRIIIDKTLNQRGMLQHAKPNSDQQRARDKILDKLPQNVEGSYSRLQFGLDDVIRLLSTRSAIRELDRMLDQSMSSHEAAIKNLQRSLTADEISELNELLKWVLFSNEAMTLDQLEAALFLYSDTESLASLQYIIKNKYSAVLKIDNGYVYGQDGVKDYLRKEIDSSSRSPHAKDRSTISMTITINNVDQELCGHFLWDLAHKAIRDKFNFNIDGDASNALHSSNWGTIAVDEFEANHTIVKRAFEYLNKPHREQTEKIGAYLVCWLPYHLNRLRELEDEDQGALLPSEQSEIGQNLYKLFKSGEIFTRHIVSFDKTWWVVGELEDLQKWFMDSAIMRRVDKKWRDEVQLAASPTRGYLKEFVKVLIGGFLRDRSWMVYSAWNWLEEFMKADDKKLEAQPTPNNSDAYIAREIDWNHVGTWCQGILELPDSELNSLWYERLAEASFSQSKHDVTLSLYQRAIKEKNPSWMCHRGLGIAHYKLGQTQEALEQLELALDGAEREDAAPKPEADDLARLYLLLGQYAYESGDMRKAEKYYSFPCNSDNPELARRGRLGRLKARLGFPDVEETRQLLKSALSQENGKEEMASVLKMVARDSEHDTLISRMFAVTKGDPDLLKHIVGIMQTATMMPASDEDRTTETPEEDRFLEDESCGVLLYDQGFAAYRYGVSPDDAESINEALRLWRESRDKLANLGGSNALLIRQRATSALASHYFQTIMDKLHEDHYDALIKLTKLANSDPDFNIYRGDSVGFLGTVLALNDKKESSKAVLVKRIRQALQILSDDIAENDKVGFAAIQKTLEHYQDFKNAAAALSLLGQPDLVTDALYFEAEDITEVDDEDKQRVLGMIAELAKQTVHAAKVQFPNTTQQAQRIEAAKAHVDSLVAAASETKTKPETNGGLNGDGKDEKPSVPEVVAAHAHRLLQARLSALQKTHTPTLDDQAVSWRWFCNGRTPDGKECENRANFETEFYHCIYCSDVDFCSDCFARLRDPVAGVGITECSPKHKWLETPRQGDEMYVNPRTGRVRLPIDVRALDGDDKVLRAYYAEDGSGEEMTIEAWKEGLAREWGISLDEIRDEISRQATPENGDENEKDKS